MSENYEFIGNIGQGMSGQVYKARNIKENKFYAIKKLNFNDLSEKERISIEGEVNLLKELKHPNIVSYKDSFFDKDNYLNIVMVFCEGGDMYTKIRKQKGAYFDEETILKWIAQLCLALSYVHDKQILHRDIKTQNIFIQNEHTIRIGDFGIAKGYNQNQNLGGALIGTPLYMAPEVYNSSKKYSFRSDIWSLGCCIFEMCNLKNAFEAKSWNAVFVKVNKGVRAPLNSKYSFDMKNLVDSMLNVKGNNRPTIASILEKPFMKPKVGEYISDFILNFKKYGGDEEQVAILKEQAEKFCIFNINMNNEIFGEQYENKLKNKDKEDLKDINENEKRILIEHRKEIEQKLKELENEKKKILENRKRERDLIKKNSNNYYGKSNSLSKEKEIKIKSGSLEKKTSNKGHYIFNQNSIPDGTGASNKKASINPGGQNNIKRHQGYNENYNSIEDKRKSIKGGLGLHQNSDCKFYGINSIQDVKENNGIGNKNDRPLTSNKKGADNSTEPDSGNKAKDGIRGEREEKKLNLVERNRLTKIIQEIGKLKKEIEQIDNKAISFNQYNINNENAFNENKEISNASFSNIHYNGNLTKNSGSMERLEEENEYNNNYGADELINNSNYFEYKNIAQNDEYTNHKLKIENIINNPQTIVKERIIFFKERCINSIGNKIFIKAYEYLKGVKIRKVNNKSIDYNKTREELINILGKSNVGFWQIIDQILLLEELEGKI